MKQKHELHMDGFDLYLGTGNIKTGEMATVTARFARLLCDCGWRGDVRSLGKDPPFDSYDLRKDVLTHLGVFRGLAFFIHVLNLRRKLHDHTPPEKPG